ncbi:VPS9 domain-containing protein 1 isoform X3 [Girardinichthys multiradiatus]|uniref:VPS9 domain-containing protein 1 isoform X3 n=1 Tax=Girardinichthys multiradiatus TaxID=208333 RepID=UPI001FAD1435|nr:VPS9 domain-containing protein 1 isoform X3 [Girardinichthys multiradiatus]
MAAADSGLTHLQSAMKMAKEAIQLEGGNRHKEAYFEYLRTINYISHVLLQQEKKEMVEVERMLRLAEQCLERAKSFLGKHSDPADLPTSPYSSSLVDQSEPVQTEVCLAAVHTASAADSHIDVPHRADSPTKSGHRRVLSDGGGELSPFPPPDVFQRLQTVASPDLCKKELTPVEEASRLNQKLKATFEARVARLTPGQAYQKTSLTLSLQRHMMENLIIAKARQDALQRKVEERRLRLQEEANRRLVAFGALTADEQEQRLLYANVLEYEQDHDWPKQWRASIKKNPDSSLVLDLVSYLLSRSDHPVVKLLKKHQYRIYNKLYPIVSKSLPQSPALLLRPSRSVHNLLHPECHGKPIRTASDGFGGHSFSTDASFSPSRSHDLHTKYDDEDDVDAAVTVDQDNSFEDLEQFMSQLDWTPPVSSMNDSSLDTEVTCDPSMELDGSHMEELELRTLKEHLKAIVKDIHIAVDQLLSLCLLSFDCLNTATFKDLCLCSIEDTFFTPLWSALVALFRRVHREREQLFEKNMRRFCSVSPADVGIPLKLFPQDSGVLKDSYPYESAVHELKLLVHNRSPQRKLECIVRTLRLICACAEEYKCLQGDDPTPKTEAIGADDLLPILSFVALRCQCPQLVSECAALEEFIHENYLIGEEGYCLTSLQSALAYVESLQAAVNLQ